MVIQCPHCQARFKLPQDKVKPGGTKVRCTKCKIVFMVTPPQDDSSTALARDSGSEDATREPEESYCGEDFGSDFEADFEANFEAADFFSDGDEGDEFLLSQTTDEDNGADFFAAEDSAVDRQDDLTWAEDTEDTEDPFAVPETGGGEEEEETLPSTADLFPPPVAEPSPEEPLTAEETTAISLTLATEDAAETDDGTGGLSDEEPFFEESLPRSPLPSPRPPAERRKRSLWGRLWLLVLVLALAGGGYAYHAREQVAATWQKLLIDWQLIPVPPTKAEGLKPVKLAGYFITNRREGRLFVVQGQVLNEGPEARAAIVVQGTVYDRAGGRVAQQSAFCGNPMSKEQLRAWSMLRMSERMQNQFGEMLANLNLEPQKAIPFTLVFKGLPGEVAEFEVAVATSEPVIK